MDFKRILVLLVFFVLVVLTASRIANAQTQAPHPDESAQVIKLLKCIENDQYGAFVEGGSDYFKSRISKEHFHNVSERLAQHLKNGYDIKFLTEFKQADLVGTLWKIEYRDGFDDALVKIFMENGKIEGLWFQ
ncbi:MAG: hypothetical protein ACYDHG_01900 [Desulfomonilaceae bacterium]